MSKTEMRTGTLIVCLALFGACSEQAPEPEAMAVNATIYTMNPDQPTAQALAWDAGGWIVAIGQTAELRERWPDVSTLDLDGRIVIPGLLERIDGHAVWANSVAIRRLETSLAGDWQPEGGKIHRNDDGEPTGIFIDRAENVFDDAIPAPTEAEKALALDRALEHMVSLGLTGVHEAGTSLAELRRYLHRATAGTLPVRLHAYANGDNAALEALCRLGPLGTDRVTARGVKYYADGALGSRGAALLEEYSDHPGNRGLLFETDQAMQRMVDKAMASRLEAGCPVSGSASRPRSPASRLTRHTPDLPKIRSAASRSASAPISWYSTGICIRLNRRTSKRQRCWPRIWMESRFIRPTMRDVRKPDSRKSSSSRYSVNCFTFTPY